MIKIESYSNTIFKETKKLLSSSGRKKAKAFIIEGERLVFDALKNGARIKYILISEDSIESFGNISDKAETYILADKLFSELKTTVNSQGIMAVAYHQREQTESIDYSKGTYLYLDNVTDPGNMGTIIRTADAFGIAGIILSKGCVDVYNPKVLRSTMAGIFNIKLYFDEENLLKTFKQEGFEIIGTFLDGKSLSKENIFSSKNVIVMGNEANGITKDIEQLCTKRVTIPMTGGAESLNVAVACGIMLYESFISCK